MKRSRLVLALGLTVAAFLAGRLLLRENSNPVRALDPHETLEKGKERRKPKAELSATTEPSPEVNTPKAPASIEIPDQAEERVAIQAPDDETSRDLVVRVVDRLGAPIEGMTLELHGLDWMDLLAHRTTTSANLLGTEPPAGTTDAEGRIVFEKLKGSLASVLHAGTEGVEIYLEHQVIFDERPKRFITLADLASEEILCEQPDYGTIRGVVRGPYGRTDVPVDEVNLELVDGLLEESDLFGTHSQSFDGSYENGEALFRFVQLDRKWALRAQRDGRFEERSTQLGPRLHLQQVEMEVQFGASQPILLYRILGADGFALANADIQIAQHHAMNWNQPVPTRTDERGDVLLYLNLIAYSSFNVQIRVTHEDQAGRTLHALAPALKDLNPGINDLGVLQLQAPEILAHGTVVDERGEPVAGATVRMGTHTDYTEPAWLQSENVETKSDPQGRFEFTGIANDSPRGVWAFHGSERSEREALEPGGREHVLELRSLPTATVAVFLAEGMPSTQISVQLDHEEEDGSSSKIQWDEISEAEDGGPVSYHFKNMEPGAYGALIQLANTKQLLGRSPEVEIEESSTIATFDLRDRLFMHRVLLDFPKESEVEPDRKGGRYRQRPGGSQEAWGPWNDYRDRRIEIASTEESVDLQLMPFRFRGEELTEVRGDRRVELRPPLSVRFSLETLGELPQHPSALKMRVQRDGRDFGFALGGQAFSEDRREITYEVPDPGTYTVSWALSQTSSSFAIEGPVLSEESLEVSVTDQESEQVIPIALSAEVLTEMTRNPPW